MAFYQQQQPKMSICSEEVSTFTERKSATECIETITETLETQKLVENVMKTRPRSPPPLDTASIPCPQSIEKNVTCCHKRKDSCELRRPTEFTPNTLECQLQSQVQNPVPQGWESPMLQALKTAPDPFSQIPSKRSSSALASALKIAPAEPFTPAPFNIMDPIPLPEETVPYFPPEHPITVEPKEPKPKPEKKADSQFVKALIIAPERPFTPVGGVAPIKKKVEDPLDKFIKELPKPQEKLSMRTALTTAPERPYTPVFAENVTIEECSMEKSKNVKKETIDRSLLTKPMMPAKLPESFQAPLPQPKPIIREIPPILIHESEEKQTKEEKDSKHIRIIEKRELRPAIPSTITKNRLEEEEHQVCPNFPPIFQGFSCSFQNKTDHSQFSVEVITTPPVLTPTPTEKSHSASSLAVSEGRSGYVQTEKITEETSSKHRSSQRQAKEVTTVKPAEIVRQSEEIIQKKPLALASSLHPIGGLPQYQVNLSAEAEAEIMRMEKMEKAQKRLEQQKLTQITKEEQHKPAPQKPVRQPPPADNIRKPIITIQPGETEQIRSQIFQPVVEDKPQSYSFSPRPRSITPSRINKPPSILPYYQENLVAHICPPASVNLLDPTSPAISRSPSPCPGGRERSPSPFPDSGASAARPKSPAAGPPPNPLLSAKPLPTPRDSQVRIAKESLTTFIPQYKEKRDLIERVQGMDFYKRSEELTSQNIQEQQYQQSQSEQIKQSIQSQPTHIYDSRISQQSQEQQKQIVQPTQMYSSQVQTSSYTVPQTRQFETSFMACEHKSDATSSQCSMQKQNMQIQDSQRSQSHVSQSAQGSVSTSVSEMKHQAHLEDLKKSESKSVEMSRDGRTQIQRKQTVTEEYEHSQKAQVIEIEKNITTTKKHPFRDVNAPVIEQPGVMGLHVTNPQPLSSPFKKADMSGAFTQVPQPDPKSVCPPCTKKQSPKPDSSQCQKCPNVCPSCPNSAPTQAPPPPIRQVFAPGTQGPIKHVKAPGSQSSNQNVIKPSTPSSNVGTASGRQTGAIGAPRRGRGVLNAAAIGGSRIPLCGQCHRQIRSDSFCGLYVVAFLVFVCVCVVLHLMG